MNQQELTAAPKVWSVAYQPGQLLAATDTKTLLDLGRQTFAGQNMAADTEQYLAENFTL